MDTFDMGTAVPALVFFAPAITDDGNWQRLLSHSCDGFNCGTLEGFVQVLKPSEQGIQIMWRITDEEFCKSCSYPSLDYQVTDENRSAYRSFLASVGLVEGDMEQLVQAVYPLEGSQSNLEVLGVAGGKIPPGAALLVLGWNCD